VSSGNHEEKGSISTVRPTQLSVGCVVSVVAGVEQLLVMLLRLQVERHKLF
jgi:hypothetical protein